MIDINKKYRTRMGLPVTIKGKDDFDYWYGFVHTDDGDEIMIWTNGGAAYDEVDQYALIEINEKEELLEEAKRRYPKGTKFITPHSENPHVSNGIIDDIYFESDKILYSDGYEVYRNGKWAEIVKEHEVEVTFGINPYGEVFALQSDAFDDKPIAKKTITFYEGEGL